MRSQPARLRSVLQRVQRGMVAVALLVTCLLSWGYGMTLTPSAAAEFVIVIPYGKPTVDGVIEEGEYGVFYVMNRMTATAWVGDVGESSVTWYLAWDEGGLYYAGCINDSTPAWRDTNSHWVGTDCLELAINPGMLLKDSRAEGVFFSCGATSEGSVVVYRHNYADGLVSREVKGASRGHTPGSSSYTIELYIPWSLVQLQEDCTVGGKEDIHLDATRWRPTGGARLGLLPCAIDSLDPQGENIIAYKFNGTDFLVQDFIEAYLLKPGGGSSEETTTSTPPEGDIETPTGASHESLPSETPLDPPSTSAESRPEGMPPEGGEEDSGVPPTETIPEVVTPTDTTPPSSSKGCRGMVTLWSGMLPISLLPLLRKRRGT